MSNLPGGLDAQIETPSETDIQEGVSLQLLGRGAIKAEKQYQKSDPPAMASRLAKEKPAKQGRVAGEVCCHLRRIARGGAAQPASRIDGMDSTDKNAWLTRHKGRRYTVDANLLVEVAHG